MFRWGRGRRAIKTMGVCIIRRLWSAVARRSNPALTAYPVLRPDGNWALLVVNKDQENEHQVVISFDDTVHRQSGGFTGEVVWVYSGPGVSTREFGRHCLADDQGAQLSQSGDDRGVGGRLI
jgi:hypothetical protein